MEREEERKYERREGEKGRKTGEGREGRWKDDSWFLGGQCPLYR